MDEYDSRRLARRGAPYGLTIRPETDTHELAEPREHREPRNEWDIQHQWQRLCERHGAAILGLRDVPTGPVRAQLDGILWELRPLGNAERVVPPDVFHRWRALEAAGVPMHYWLWGEELPERPQHRTPARPAAPTRVGPNLTATPRPQRRDPLVIGVIPTAPSRGLWVLIGKWEH